MNNPYAADMQAIPVAQLGEDARATFITRTYAHLFGAIMAFVMLEVFLFKTGLILPVAQFLMQSWWLTMIAFIGASWIANSIAFRAKSLPAQYGALGIFIVAEALVFAPLLLIANSYSNGGVIETAGLITAVTFSGLTAFVFYTRKDFSFMRGMLNVGFMVAIGLIFAGFIFGFSLGLWFSGAMVLLAAGSILYQTSNVLHHYPEDRYVGAALGLFAEVALLFWYVLRLVMAFGDD